MINYFFKIVLIILVFLLLPNPANPSIPEDDFSLYAGTYSGHGAGEEVRFRHKQGLLTLTVKHKTEFVFVVDSKGKIEGEGTIEYDLTNNTTGLDNLVASVHALMGLASVPGTQGNIPQKAGEHMRDVKGVTKIQYDAPHLKNGIEIRHFKFKGHVGRDMVQGKDQKMTKKTLIYLDTVKNFTLPDGKADNTLIAEYEVNRVKSNPTFPCWSPFLKKPGILRQGPGKIHIAEFMEKGKHRQGKRVWQEYGYVWLARQLNPDKK